MDANTAAPAAAPLADPDALEKRLRGGSSWFFWIAGLSLVNTAMALSGSDRQFLVGLAMTQVVDAFAQGMIEAGAPAAVRVVAVGLDLTLAGLFVGAGLLARRRAAGLYLAAMVLYGLDAALCVLFEAWPNLAFHGLALFYLWGGHAALRALRASGAPVPEAAAGAVPARVPNRLVR
jgi:hypothetical protein